LRRGFSPLHPVFIHRSASSAAMLQAYLRVQAGSFFVAVFLRRIAGNGLKNLWIA
jgi:hypothetical protein